MKQHAFLALLLAFTLYSAADAQTIKYHSKGAYAQSNFPNISLFVGSGNVGVGGQPFLDYSTFTLNPDGSFTYSYGIGNIPSSTFTANNVQQMSLNVDTSQLTGFQAQTCVTVFQPTYSSTCSDGPYGVIQLSWQNNDYSSSTTKEKLTVVNGPVTRSIDSDSTYTSANGGGTFFGVQVQDNNSRIGTDRSRDMTLTRN